MKATDYSLTGLFVRGRVEAISRIGRYVLLSAYPPSDEPSKDFPNVATYRGEPPAFGDIVTIDPKRRNAQKSSRNRGCVLGFCEGRRRAFGARRRRRRGRRVLGDGFRDGSNRPFVFRSPDHQTGNPTGDARHRHPQIGQSPARGATHAPCPVGW